MIDKATVQRIKDTADIVEVVSDYVHLVKRGNNFMGLCPFHNERTPSFSVNRRKNMCYCFSCHKGGSPVNFIMEKEGINYHDALLYLANKYGIKVEERELTDKERLEQSERESRFIVNEWAMKSMEHNLHNTEEGRDVGLQYFYQRGLTDQAIKAFRLGYATDSFSALSKAAQTAGYDLEILESVGLVGKGSHGDYYDKFRGRVIFPIMNTAGKTVAFGGRDLKGGPAKYINSQESDIYKKSNELYGIYQAKNQIVRQNKCYLVEGYMDVIGMWQSGLENTVASSGTALTDGQIALIHRFTENITLIYDGDAAGIKASLRGIDMLLAHKLDVKVLLLPDGHDPDSFAREHSPEDMRRYINENEIDIIRFKTKVLVGNAGDDPQARTEAVRSIVGSLACIPDQIKRNIYIQECSSLMGLDEKLVARETERQRRKIIERNKTERAYRDIDSLPPATEKETLTVDRPIPAIVADKRNPLYPLEKEVLKYCVRYGMLDFCEVVDQDGNTSMISVIDYVGEELQADDMSFSVSVFGKIFLLIRSLCNEYGKESEKFHSALIARREEKRKILIEELTGKDLDLRTIEHEESLIDQRLQAELDQEFTDFTIQFVGRQLASHEDKEVREIVMDMITERHTLSKRYLHNPIDLEICDKIGELLPRAITEWKLGLISQRRNELMTRLDETVASGNQDLQRRLMSEIMELTRISAEIARQTGDRVVAPK